MSEKNMDLKRIAIDEQICALLQQRKELSSLTPGFPSDETISEWAQKYGFDDTFLATFFHLMKTEKYYKSKVEPSGFRHYIPVLQTVGVGERLYTVSYIRQYENASVVQLLVDWDEQQEPYHDIRKKLDRKHVGLFIEGPYECRYNGTSGSDGHECTKFIVTPPLPDDIKGLDFVFTQYEDVFEEKPTGFAVTIHC
ncbi:hypothetical protein [Lysinibacillus cavernae]|uniref:hypothetical protein n=1 Tax=Lysinibacillus cavernae TaxID=2666135 RepID=UPI0012D90FD9|nr:hypothetical protein [Lysinibacillus cavernae]